MMRYAILLLMLVLTVAQAQAAPKCVIVYANDRGHREVYWHEMAHCHGWKHPKTPSSANFLEARRTFDPPARLRGVPYEPRIERPVTSKEAVEICGGHIGCMWFE